MTAPQARLRIALNGYGVIGKRVADAVAAQEDMELIGIADIETDWRVRVVLQKGIRLFASLEDRAKPMHEAGLKVTGTLDDLLQDADVVVDCTPKPIGAKNAEIHRAQGVKFIVQGGEKHEVTGHSFVAEVNYGDAVGRHATRVVSCNHLSGAHADGPQAGGATAARPWHADAARHRPVGEP